MNILTSTLQEVGDIRRIYSLTPVFYKKVQSRLEPCTEEGRFCSILKDFFNHRKYVFTVYVHDECNAAEALMQCFRKSTYFCLILNYLQPHTTVVNIFTYFTYITPE